jgi:hypothetical protein
MVYMSGMLCASDNPDDLGRCVATGSGQCTGGEFQGGLMAGSCGTVGFVLTLIFAMCGPCFFLWLISWNASV